MPETSNRDSDPLDRRTSMCVAKYVAKYVAMGHDKEGEEQELKRLIPLVAIRFLEELQRNSKRRPEEIN